MISPQVYIQDPYAFFAEQRRIHPITRVDLFGGPVWLVTGFEAAEAIMKDARFLRDGRGLGGGEPQTPLPERLARALEMKQLMILVRDPPFHTRVRKLLSAGFTPSMLKSLQPDMEATARTLLLHMQERRRHDLIADYAYRFPMYVIADLIGVPPRDRHHSRRWSEAFIRFIDFHTSLEDQDDAADTLLEAGAYFRELLARRRREPRDDLISQLLAQQAQGEEISDDEIVASCVLLLSAGHETTVNLIANGYWLLCQHPAQGEKLRRDRSLLPNAIEEILRFEPPALTSSRWVAEDVEIYGKQLRRGDFLVIALGGANRDPAVMAEPDSFRIDRSPVRHLSFASGPHYCLGAQLARMEGRIAIGMLLDAIADPRFVEVPVWKDSIALRGFEALHMEAEVKVFAEGARE